MVIFSNHSALTSLQKKELIKMENQRLVSMLEKLGDFNYEIRHLAGAKNMAADYLSRTGPGIQQRKSIPEDKNSKIPKHTRRPILMEGRGGDS